MIFPISAINGKKKEEVIIMKNEKKKLVQEFGKMATAKQYCENFFLYCKAENCVATWYSVLQ